MLTMDNLNDIITLHKVEGLSLREIVRRTGYNFRTVRKYADKTDWNDGPLKRNDVESKLDPLKPLIDQWLEADVNTPRKQRHTGKRVYDRLAGEHSNELYVGMRTVQAYVSKKKKSIYRDIKDCALYLEHPSTEAQVDFGEFAYYDKDGRQRKGYGLVMSFPRSNGGYVQAFRGENQECLLEGMKRIFKHIGKIPFRIVFDNLAAAVSSIGRSGERTLVDQFKKFCLHYGFEPIFCNPGQPNEKGVYCKIK
jgi:transposase